MGTPLFTGKIKNCFDSHVHWRATGYTSRLVNLKNIRSIQDIRKLKTNDENFFESWLLGFGWDQNKFQTDEAPHRKILDEVFGGSPVLFTRIDGHVIWVNTTALKMADLYHKNISSPPGGLIELDPEGWPTGVLVDLATNLVKRHLPKPKLAQLKDELLSGQKEFLSAGFTHIRDLTCDEDQWQAASALEEEKKLKICVQQFFSADDLDDFEDRVKLALVAKKEKHTLLKPCGIKVYYDGALGSEGALISKDYSSGSGRGLRLIEPDQLEHMMRRCSEHSLELAVHVIGDQAAHEVVTIANRLNLEMKCPLLHLEHVELVRDDTLELLRHLPVICHIQPAHWLSDKRWLSKKIGELSKYAFRWNDLERLEIPFYFGSDSPIEPTSIQRTYSAIIDADGASIKRPQNEWFHYHEYNFRAYEKSAKSGNKSSIQYQSMEASPIETISEFKDGQLQGVEYINPKIF